MNLKRWAAAASLVLISVGCLSRNDPIFVRYFGLPHTSSVMNPRGKPLQLQPVTVAPYLESRMAWRRSEVELAFDEAHRWVAEPAQLVERSLRAALFERGRFSPSDEATEPRLVVHVSAFEGVLDGELARLELSLRLVKERPGFTRTHAIRIERRLDDLSPESLARALGEALDAAGDELLEWLG